VRKRARKGVRKKEAKGEKAWGKAKMKRAVIWANGS